MESFEPTVEQRRVIEHRGSHLLVFAGPGTGKTETLARRFASIVHDDHLSPETILVLTFSRRAALGMRRRIVQRLRERSGGSVAVPELHVYTFHGFCKRLLEGDSPRGAARALLTPVKERLLWNRLIADLRLATFSDEVVSSNAFATAVLNLIARLKGDGISPAQFAAEGQGDARHGDLARLYALMDAERERRGLFDFRDLVVDAVTSLEQRTSPARAWLARRSAFRHVLVDEFQDSDHMQVRLLEVFGGTSLTKKPPQPEMCFVGDFNQSIYRFRGAAPENIVEAKRRFGCEELTLSLNRRSVQAVLDVANRTPFLRPESLTSSDPANDRVGFVRLTHLETIDDEIGYIGDTVADQIRSGTKPSQIAVLLRVVEPYRSAIVRELQARAIPVAAQSNAGFHEDSLIGAVMSAMRVLAGDDDAAAWRRFLTNPLVGFRPLTVSLAIAAGRQTGIGPRAAFDAYPPTGRRDWATFAAALDACLRTLRTMKRFDPAALVQTIVRELDLLWPLRERTDVPAFDALASPARLTAFLQAAHDIRDVEPASGPSRLDAASFLRAVDTLLPLLGEADEGPRSDESGVAVMSIHGAKGLEFDVVIVPQLIDGVLPTRARPDPLFGNRPSRYVRSAEEDAVEEASLWYVALTRARFGAIATAARLGDEATEQPLSAFAQQIADYRRIDAVAGRSEDVGFAAAYAAASPDERASAAVTSYLDRRPVLEAFVTTHRLYDQKPGPIVWPLRRLSPSGIETYVACPRRWFYREAMQLPSDDADVTRMGRFVHAVLERYHTRVTDFSGGASLSADAIAAELAPLALEEAALVAAESGLTTAAPLFRYETARITRQLAAYARWLVEESRVRPFTVLACERRVEVELAGVRLAGRVDRVDRLADGTLAIRDYKSGKQHSPRGSAVFAAEALETLDATAPGLGLFGNAQDGLKLQTYLYVRAVEAMFGARVARADYLYLGGSSKDRLDISVDTTLFGDGGKRDRLSDAQLQSVYETLAGGVAQEISQGQIAAFVTAAREAACGLCTFTQICPGPGSVGYDVAAVTVNGGPAGMSGPAGNGEPAESVIGTALSQLPLPLDGRP